MQKSDQDNLSPQINGDIGQNQSFEYDPPDASHPEGRFVYQAGSPRTFSIRKSFAYALDGFVYVVKSQRNIKIQLAIAVIAIILGLIFRIDFVSWAAITICIMVTISLELVNTAIESGIDEMTSEWSLLAKHAKDCAAAAVLMASVGSVAVACFIYIPAFVGFLHIVSGG